METLCYSSPDDFVERFYLLKIKHQNYLNERNEKRQFAHKNIRSAFRSLQNNMPTLFTYYDMPEQTIPTTTGRLEGLFSHLKEKIRVHRGLKMDRKKKAIKCFLNNAK